MKNLILICMSIYFTLHSSVTYGSSEQINCLQDAIVQFSKNPNDCYKLFSKLHAQMNTPETAFNLSICYLHGLGVAQNANKAFKLMEYSASGGYANAENALGTFYEQGVGTRKNDTNAFNSYLTSAQKGNIDAQYATGRCYENSIGTKKSLSKAITWYQKAAEKGHVLAQDALALCYRLGKGVESDEEKARFWYQKAKEQGDELARKALEEMGYSKRKMLIY